MRKRYVIAGATTTAQLRTANRILESLAARCWAVKRKPAESKQTLAALRRELRELRDAERAANLQWFFKTEPGGYGEGDRFLGIRMPALRVLAGRHGTLSSVDVKKLLDSSYHEERMLALLILVRQYERGNPAVRESIYQTYMNAMDRVNNWDLVDGSAPHIVGAHLRASDRTLLYDLARSENLWKRRIAMLATFAFIRDGDYNDALAIARILLHDREDLIHKSVGWMLREIGNRDRAVEESFLREHHAVMPRTMLRYAIEKFPERERKRWLAAGKRSS